MFSEGQLSSFLSMDIQLIADHEYQALTTLDLYDSPACERLATQCAANRHLRYCSSLPSNLSLPTAFPVRLCEDDYPAWLAAVDLPKLTITATPYQPILHGRRAVVDRLPLVVAFTETAMASPNYYRWGGTVAPNYDCSGLIQAAFSSVGIWLPRDAYQQEAFVSAIEFNQLQIGDLVFFGPSAKATHVGLYVGNERYIHSSGKDMGRNGIGIDQLSAVDNVISHRYRSQLRGAGRVMASYVGHVSSTTPLESNCQ